MTGTRERIRRRREDPESSIYHGLTAMQSFRKFLYNYNAIHEGFTSSGALAFLVGSVMFLWEELVYSASLLFTVGAALIFTGTIGDAFVTWERKVMSDEEEKAAVADDRNRRPSPHSGDRGEQHARDAKSKYIGYSHSPKRRKRHHRKAPKLRRFLREYHYISHILYILGHACFVVGSVFFLDPETERAGIWVFIAGSSIMFVGNTGTGLVKYEERQLSEDRERDIGRSRKQRKPQSKKQYLRLLVRDYIYIHTVIHNLGHICFIVGSVLFLYKSTERAGIWLFIAGSIGYFIGAIGNGFVIYEERHLSRERKQEGAHFVHEQRRQV